MSRLMIDSNVVFIATAQIGEAWAAVILEEVAKGRVPAATDTFFLQELLDVYHRDGELRLGKRLYRSFRALCGDCRPVTAEDFDLAARMFAEGAEASPRDLLHAAVMRNQGIPRIFSIDGPRFDHVPGVQRVKLPELLAELGLKGNYTYERTRPDLHRP